MKQFSFLLLLPLLNCHQEIDRPAPTREAELLAGHPVRYRVTFEAMWSAATHAPFPAGGHFLIAPSPDWFAALENENLLENGQWVAQRSVPARAYDAGTDSGPTFTAPDRPTTPAQPIRPLGLAPASGLFSDGPPVGVWRLERLP